MGKSFAEILKEEENIRWNKIQNKLPFWAAVGGLEFPSALCLEQCSSELAARHKAGLLAEKYKASRIADLTGGLGVDSWAFSLEADAVLHNEMNTELGKAAENNLSRLGRDNVSFSNHEIRLPESGGWIQTLREFGPEVIYLDPARRDAGGRKVFLLEDCSPDFLGIKTALLGICPSIALKISPMADISMLISRLGQELEEIHIVSIKGEVKELLCLLNRGFCGIPLITARELHPGREFEFSYRWDEERKSAALSADCIKEGDMLLEPSASILKAGCFRLVSEKFGVRKLSGFTHLYTGDPGTDGKALFKQFRIIETLPFNSEGFREAARKYPNAEVSARNVPISSDNLRSRLKAKPGGGIHIWGCTVGNERKLIVCSKEL